MKKLSESVRIVGLLGNSGKPACAEVVRLAAEMVNAAGRSIASDQKTALMAGLQTTVYADPSELAASVDLLLVFGGDGTILGVAREVAGCRTPILGVNIGSLGFLTAVPSDEMGVALEHVWNGDFTFENRSLICATLLSRPQISSQNALNDIVFSRGMASRLIELEVKVDGEMLTRYKCDGIIVSTPTGSTAYSLAAGGAVVFPTAEVLALTPICPHTLSNRALIVPDTATIDVEVISSSPATIMSADGQVVTELSEGDRVRVARAARTVRLMHLGGSSFCDTLRRKLHWRGANL